MESEVGEIHLRQNENQGKQKQFEDKESTAPPLHHKTRFLKKKSVFHIAKTCQEVRFADQLYVRLCDKGSTSGWGSDLKDSMTLGGLAAEIAISP